MTPLYADHLIGSPDMTIDALGRILVVAATDRELAPSTGWRTLRCGVGPVDAAAHTAAALARQRPSLVVHVGIAGARRASGLVPPQLVIATDAIYCDLTVPERFAPNRLTIDRVLIEAASRALPAAVRGVIGTSGTVGRTSECEVEAMEGFAVLRACALAGVPALEVRAIANAIEEPDRARWSFDAAFAAIVAATPAIVAEMTTCVS